MSIVPLNPGHFVTYIRELEAHIKLMQGGLDDAVNWIRDVKAALGVSSTAEVIPAIRALQGAMPLIIDEVPILVKDNAKA